MSQQPRLVLAVTTDLTYDQRMQRICGSLAGAGYRVQLVGWQRPASVELRAQPYGQHRLRGFFQRGKFFYLEYNLRLLVYLLGQRADLWACADLDAALPTWLRARLGGQPFAYDAHELFTDVPEVVARPAVRRVWQWVERFIVPRAQLRYTVGPALARLFEERYPGCSFAVVRNAPVGAESPALATLSSELPDSLSENYNQTLRPEKVGCGSKTPLPDAGSLVLDRGVPPPGTSATSLASAGAGPTSERPTLLYQGALNVGRGLEALLAAMPQVPARLLICGEGDLSAALRAQAAQLGLLASGQVEFAGYVQPTELRRLTATATVGIMLLENVGLSYYYSLANKFFDYVQAGIPQLCIDFPEYRALCQQHAVAELVPDLAAATLVAALGRLLPGGRPGDYYQQLAAACQQARREWTWQQEAQTLLHLYKEAVGAPLAAATPALGQAAPSEGSRRL